MNTQDASQTAHGEGSPELSLWLIQTHLKPCNLPETHRLPMCFLEEPHLGSQKFQECEPSMRSGCKGALSRD